MPQEPWIRGDARCHAIAAASILAKTTRDELMVRMDDLYPGYGFAGHKGYPTETHRDALRRLGPSPIHRRSFTLLPRLSLWDAP
jgi:ribonuclease HII